MRGEVGRERSSVGGCDLDRRPHRPPAPRRGAAPCDTRPACGRADPARRTEPVSAVDQLVADQVAAHGVDVVWPRSCRCCAAEGRSVRGRTRPMPWSCGFVPDRAGHRVVRRGQPQVAGMGVDQPGAPPPHRRACCMHAQAYGGPAVDIVAVLLLHLPQAAVELVVDLPHRDVACPRRRPACCRRAGARKMSPMPQIAKLTTRMPNSTFATQPVACFRSELSMG